MKKICLILSLALLLSLCVISVSAENLDAFSNIVLNGETEYYIDDDTTQNQGGSGNPIQFVQDYGCGFSSLNDIVAFNDVDFCMKLVEAGFKNVQCNGAVMLHHESLTRGFDGDNDEKWYRLLAEKEGLYKRHPKYKAYDPYHNINLIDNSSEYICSCKTKAQDLDWRSDVIKVEEAKQEIAGAKDFGFRLKMDHSFLQRRFNPEDEDFFWIDGWVYVPGADHTLIKKYVMLQNVEAGSIYKTDSCDAYRADVENLLTAAKNIAMSGFLARISPDALPKGEYRVGLMLSAGSRTSLIWSDRTIVAKG